MDLEKTIDWGEIDTLVENYRQKLREKPNDPDTVAAFYAFRFWQNRKDLLALYHRGEKRARFLQNEVKEFEKAMEEKGFANHAVFRLIVRSIHRHIAEELRYSFEFETSRSMDKDLLDQIGFALFMAEEYQYAVEILTYGFRLYGSNPKGLVLAGECYHRLGDEEESLKYYREALVGHTDEIQLNWIQTPAVLDLIETLKEKAVPAHRLLDYAFIEGILLDVFCYSLPLNPMKIQMNLDLIHHLEGHLKRWPDSQDHRLLLVKRILYLLDYFLSTGQERRLRDQLKEKLKAYSEEVYSRLSAGRKSF